MRNFGLVAVLAGSVALAGCGEREVILEGERLDPRAVLAEGETTPAEAPAAKALSLPAAQANADWTHRGGNVRHALGHVALGQGLNRVFSANIGQGETRKNRIGADPIVAGGRIYTMDPDRPTAEAVMRLKLTFGISLVSTMAMMRPMSLANDGSALKVLSTSLDTRLTSASGASSLAHASQGVAAAHRGKSLSR